VRARTPTAGDASSTHHPRRGSRLAMAAVTVAGITLLWGALALGGYAMGWQAHARTGAARLLAKERSVIRHAATEQPDRTCAVRVGGDGQLDGLLRIPSLGLSAPVEQGTTDAVLDVAVGHDSTSAWPGAAGAAVLLAHDVSFFGHLGQLKAGDRVLYETACAITTFTVTDSQVVPAGTALPNSTAPTLVLDTCYPPDALFFTSQRLVVNAVESAARSNSAGRPGSDAVASTPTPPTYTVPVPPALAAEGLTLANNEVPMGILTLGGQTAPSFEQSPGPLDLEAAALEAYFAGLHAAAQGEGSWWSAITQPAVPVPPPLNGGVITGHDSPLDVEILSAHDSPTAVVLTTTVSVTGGAAPGTYDEAVHLVVTSNTVTIAGWSMTPEATT